VLEKSVLEACLQVVLFTGRSWAVNTMSFDFVLGLKENNKRGITVYKYHLRFDAYKMISHSKKNSY
jgi:hypothetical protein